VKLPFKRNEPGVWISAGVHVAVLTAAMLTVAAPALPDAQEGVPVEVMTEQQYSELTKGETNADKPQTDAKPRADRKADKAEEREPENAKVDAPAPPKRPADMKVASAEEMPLRADEADPAEAKAKAAEAKAAEAKAAEAKAVEAKAAEAKAAKAEAAKAEAARAKAEAVAEAKAAEAKAAAAAKAEAKAAAVKREQLAQLIEKEEAEAAAKAEAEAEKAAEKAAKAKAEAKARADAKARAEAEAEAKAEKAEAEKARAEAKAQAEKAAKALAEKAAKAEAEHQKEVAEAAAAKAEAAAKAKADAAAKAKAKAMADAKAKADGEAKAKKQAELAEKFSAGDIRQLLASKAPSQSTGATGRDIQRTASLGAATGNAPRLSPSLREALVGMLQQQIERCYVAPPGAAQGVILPMLDIRLNQDGTLTTEPRIMRGGANAVDRSIAEAAQRAVRRCAPYKIPAQYAPYYNDWKAINAEFEFSRV
jgi:colicin import membrane protein